jgi:type IV secretion system protein VirB5
MLFALVIMAAAGRLSISPKESADNQPTANLPPVASRASNGTPHQFKPITRSQGQLSMFRRPSVHYGRMPEPVTPHQKAAQAWDERIGSARVQAKNWRLMAFGCLMLSGGLAGGLVWQSAQGSITPWVVEVDRLGQTQRVAPANIDYQPTDAQIAYHLARFIEDVRGLPADGIVLRQNWLRAYDFTTDRGAAALNDFARNNDPFAKLGKAQISVDVSSVIRASSESFRVAWTQRIYENGSLSATERWTAILTVAIETPRDAERLRKNPLGVYVRAINWSKELGQ